MAVTAAAQLRQIPERPLLALACHHLILRRVPTPAIYSTFVTYVYLLYGRKEIAHDQFVLVLQIAGKNDTS